MTRMASLAFVVVVSFLVCGAYGSSPPLSDEEISELPVELQAQFALPPQSLLAHHTRVGFKHRWVDHAGRCHTSKPSGASVSVDSTTTVSDLALSKACHIVGLMVRHMSTDMFNHISRGHGVGLFAKSEGIGIYPENYNLRDTPECKGRCDGTCKHTCTFDGRKYDSIAGLSNSRSVVLDDNVLCSAHDPYGHKENILVHEFSHQIQRYMPTEDKNKLNNVFNYAKQHHTWGTGYGTANTAEYWAEATEAFFHVTLRKGTHGPAVGMVDCSMTHLCRSETENRAWLKQHDLHLYELLVKVYTNNRPNVHSGLKVCQ